MIKKTIPVTLHDILSTLRDTAEKFELEGELLKMITNKNFNIDLANLSNKKLIFQFARKIYFDESSR